MRHGLRGTVAAAACLALSGISPAASLLHRGAQRDAVPPSLAKPEQTFPVNVTWTLSRLGEKQVVGDPPSFSLDDKFHATGFAGCNSFAMELYPVRGQKLLASAIAVTRKACDAATSLRERSFLVGLHSQPRWRLEDADLVLVGYGGTMRFRRGL